MHRPTGHAVDMLNHEQIDSFVLQEFRLHVADGDGAVARIVASSSAGSEHLVPLLTSIDDGCDVAMIRAQRASDPAPVDVGERDALGPFVSSWQEPRQYVPRVAEHSQDPPAHYRLAVTESGINDEKLDRVDAAVDTASDRPAAVSGTSAPLGLLWIGHPVGTHAGLLILLGLTDGAERARPDPLEWPLPLSLGLGVRIYTGVS